MVSPDFAGWIERARPEMRWDYPHFRYMQRYLDRVTSGELRRVLFQVAVRHGKTEHNTISYAAYRLELDPSTRILLGTYSQKQAHKLSRQIRRLARKRGVDMSSERDAVGEWETLDGGGLRAVGSGTGVASVNADLILIDDPIGSREEAESKAHRDRVWLWITNDILARCEPHTAVLFSMPRWHMDDPAGRMQEHQPDRWTIVDLPGIADEDDPLGRAEGELLWPDLRPQSWVDEMRVDLGRYGFAALVQGRPSPKEGGLFKWSWMEDQFVEAIPVGVKDRVRYWDTAGTEDGGDYTAGVRVSIGSDDLYYIESVVRGQWAPGRRDTEIQKVCREDDKLPGPYRVGVEEESGINGKKRTQAIVRQLSGLKVFTERPTGDKELRADPVASQMQVGNVRIVRSDRWNRDFYDELLSFPNGEHDDQVDALSGAFSALSEPVPKTHIVRIGVM